MLHFIKQIPLPILILTTLSLNVHAAKNTKAAPALPSQSSKTENTKTEQLINAVQKQYNSLKSATFNFEQSYKHPFLNIQESSKGQVSYAKTSGKMVWSYEEPKDKQKKFYIDGKKFTYYSVADKTAFTHDCYDQDTLSAAVTFLLGKGLLKQSFSVKLLTEDVPNKSLSWLELTPKEIGSPVKRIFLGIEKASKVLESVVEDPSGGKNHFKFIDFKINPAINPKTFVFVPPAGVLVQKMPNVSCKEQKPPAKTTKQPTKKSATK